MAPLLSGVRWLSEAGVVGSGTAAATGAASWPQSEQLVLVVTLSIVTGFLLLSVLLGLCASCRGQKKATNGHPAGDQQNLVNGVSEKEVISQSADSPVTDAAVSSSHNGPLTSGTILSDTQDTSPQLSEEQLSSQSELRSSKYHQDRELPSLPPGSTHMEGRPPPSGDSTYEVVKEMEVASRDVSVEDSLYETVKEIKDTSVQPRLANGTVQPSPDEPPAQPHVLVNGHPSPCTPERGPLCEGVEYASVDLRKKSRHSADLEANRGAEYAAALSQQQRAEEPEDDPPPPVPEKVLVGNDGQSVVMNGLEGAGLHNGELKSPPSPPPDFKHLPTSDNESPLYSTVNKTNCDQAANEDDKEHDYSSIAEINGLVPASSSSDLYATVHDIYAQPDEPQPGDEPPTDSSDPGYESIRIPKTSSSDDDRRAGNGKPEPDYESVGELGLGREMSRL
ncbi:phosphoprotein associated with glycosphingolipid-enriched microdomains 1 isoform X2 [Fundulus heteroclitus]|uniref:phosphoprotein associated with glycosphingolipid-enriched microdomains 1 isoform X2 n=1 Tax=Fundulus heteroclitus TaxID=8078 RepID=UPI00165B5F07|nr:phosphoprotein associated with glycosphingolipid-enriched microdomains 1 isoform X2 [Fundulus heteroclitus]XP_012724059.3 phosphoprotein associated with glycosphingolipid-enriched microdomains 1 isoform X2 [Fundulus heteroclitus]